MTTEDRLTLHQLIAEVVRQEFENSLSAHGTDVQAPYLGERIASLVLARFGQLPERDWARVHVVVNWRTGRVHGMTGDVNKSREWTQQLCERYGDPMAATQWVDVIDPRDNEIPIEERR